MEFFVDLSAPNASAFSNTYYRIHQALEKDNQKNPNNIAVFFPQYHYCDQKREGSLGRTIRVFATSKQHLEDLLKNNPLAPKDSRVKVGVIKPVPAAALHVNVRRRQKKNQSDMRRLAQRAVKAGRAANEKEAIEKMVFIDRVNSLPKVFVFSRSTRQIYPIHIELSASATPIAGKFDSFGLSKTATIPYFE